MTVNELIEKLKRYDGNSTVAIMSYFAKDLMAVKEVFKRETNSKKELVIIHNDDDDFELDDDAWFYEKKKGEE